METMCIPKEKLGEVIIDVEKLISDFEDLIEDQDKVVKQRLSDVKEGKVEGRSEEELDDYLEKRGVKVD